MDNISNLKTIIGSACPLSTTTIDVKSESLIWGMAEDKLDAALDELHCCHKHIAPKIGDRIIIKEITGYKYRQLYDLQQDETGLGVISFIRNDYIVFMCGYTPYQSGDGFSCSGSGNSIDKNYIDFHHRGPAPFFKFKSDIKISDNVINYDKDVNWFSIHFSDIE